MEVSMLILQDREKRYNKILELIKEFQLPVLCGKLNYPGREKNTKEANRAFEVLTKKIKEKFCLSSIHELELSGYDGKSILLVVNMLPEEVKKQSVAIEDNCSLGRIFDIDVYAGEGSSIGREEIQVPARKCIVCGDIARVCVRSGRHTLDETIGIINKIINNYGEENE